MEGISKGQVSRICQDLDEEVEGFRTRELEGRYPYLWLDATFLKVRGQGQVVSQAVVHSHRDEGYWREGGSGAERGPQ